LAGEAIPMLTVPTTGLPRHKLFPSLRSGNNFLLAMAKN